MESTSPAQLDTVSQPEAPAASRYSLRWLFFPLALLYHELLLRAFDSSTVFFDAALAPTALTALGLGLLISLLANALPCRRVSRWAALILTLLWTVCVCVEYCCKSYFKSYFALTFMVTMTGHVVGDFAGTIPDVVLPRLPSSSWRWCRRCWPLFCAAASYRRAPWAAAACWCWRCWPC